MKAIFFTFCFLISSVAFGQEICTNGIDDDGDLLVDLNDTADCVCSGLGNPVAVPSIIPNSSFEAMNCCPTTYSEVNCATGWIQATDATSDYMNTCGIVFGAATAAGLVPFPDGEGILGAIYAVGWQEYVGSCLSQPMLAGTNYQLSMSIASTPIDGGGGECNGGVINYDPIDIIIYGNPSCAQLPVATSGCPDGADPTWVILGSVNYVPSTSWGTITINFTPSADMNAIIFGPPCTMPPTYPDVFFATCYPYFYYDNLVLNASSLFGSSSITETGSFCSNNVVMNAHTDTVGGTWQWFLNGVALTGQTDSTINISGSGLGAGDYEAMYTVGLECYTASHVLTMTGVPTASFTSTNACPGSATNFTSTSTIGSGTITSLDWLFPGGTPSTGTGTTPSSTYSLPGNYSVTLITTSNTGCIDSVTQIVNVSEFPVASFTSTPDCPGQLTGVTSTSTIGGGGSITGWTWSFTGGTPSTGTGVSGSSSFPAGGNYNVTLIATSSAGCSDTIVQFVNVPFDPTPDFGITNACVGFPGSFIDSSTVLGGGTITNWAWNFGDGNNSTSQNPTHIYSPAGTYNVQLVVTSNNGCQDSITIPITIYPEPVVNLGLDTTFYCESSSVILDAGNPGSSYLWNTTATTQTIAVNNVGWYEVVVTTPFSCFESDSIYVRIDSLPHFKLLDVTVCEGDSAVLWVNSNEGTSFAWSTGSPDTLIYTFTPGFYNLTITNSCGSTTDTAEVKFLPHLSNLALPNMLTPNGDGNNDEYTIPILSQAISFRMDFFNRWGVLLHTQTDVNDNWKGTSSGTTLAPPGTYFVIITFLDCNNEEISKSQFITVFY